MARTTAKNAPEMCTPRISTVIASLATASAKSTSTSASGCQSDASDVATEPMITAVRAAVCTARMVRLRVDTTARSSAGPLSDLTHYAGSPD